MALVKTVSGDCGLNLGSVCCTFGRKRILVRNNGVVEEFAADFSDFNTPRKRLLSREIKEFEFAPEMPLLETLPQEILIKILCGVDHDDLKQLFHVSSSIREATVIAKKVHFAYTTPSKIRASRSSMDLQNSEELSYDDGIEAPNAPKQSRVPRSRIGEKKLADIAVALFASKEERWPRRSLFATESDE
ncbi:hypothetical protein Ancab_005154 [Ancistrocladus abbreviatus]